MHFRAYKIDGIVDLESIQILDSLCQRKAKLQISEQPAQKNVTFTLPEAVNNNSQVGIFSAFNKFCVDNAWGIGFATAGIVACVAYNYMSKNTP